MAVVGDLLNDGIPALLLLTGIHFSSNLYFQGVSRTKLEKHVGALDLKTGGPDAHTQQVTVESDEGFLKVLSRGLCFLSSEMVGEGSWN